jgi:hypothetical protein
MTARLILVISLWLPTAFAQGLKAGTDWDPTKDRDYARLMCEDGFYFRSCFSTSRATCENAVQELSRACARTVKRAPAGEDQIKWATRIGICVGEQLERQWKQKKSNSAKCDRAEEWQ